MGRGIKVVCVIVMGTGDGDEHTDAWCAVEVIVMRMMMAS